MTRLATDRFRWWATVRAGHEPRDCASAWPCSEGTWTRPICRPRRPKRSRPCARCPLAPGSSEQRRAGAATHATEWVAMPAKLITRSDQRGERPPNHCLQWQPGFPIDANVTLQGLRHGSDDPAQRAEHVVAPGMHTVPVHLATGTDRACTEGGNTNESDRGH
jgi:hypothetical protein